MASSTTVYIALLVAVTCFIGSIKTRPHNFDLKKTINGGGANWKQEKGYMFKWQGAFKLGVPKHATCPLVLQPENGRFVCSVGTLLERSMCLVECKLGFEQAKAPVVYICQDGKWLNLRRQPIATPEPQCVPRPINTHNFAD